MGVGWEVLISHLLVGVSVSSRCRDSAAVGLGQEILIGLRGDEKHTLMVGSESDVLGE